MGGTPVSGVAGPPPLLAAKLRPPSAPDRAIDRPRLHVRLAAGERVGLVVAPPGYGKTVAVRQWIAASEVPSAWVSLDLLDDDPLTFWRHVIGALRRVAPTIDDEAETALVTGEHEARFLGVLLAQLEAWGRPVTLVLDDLTRVSRRRVLDGLTLLVERLGHQVRVLVTARADPGVPLARWRSNGWIAELREQDLRLTPDEALAVAATFDGLDLSTEAVLALHQRVDGWPIGLHLALEAMRDAPDAESVALAIVRSERLLTDYLVAEVVDQLPAAHREVALDLSVVDHFDARLCMALAGPDAARIVAELQRRRLFLTELGDGSGEMRFHSLIRELLESELKWRDPARHAELHRRAAEWRLEQDDLNAAYRHLVAAGDPVAASALVVEPVLDRINRGDRAGLAVLMGALPPTTAVDQPALAMDLALASFFAGNGTDGAAWCDRAERLPTGGAPGIRRRLHATRCILSLMDGDLASAQQHVDGFRSLDAHAASDGPIERRFFTVAARVALASGDLASARTWLDRGRATELPEYVAQVIVPALEAWYDRQTGAIGRAVELAERACAWAEHAGMRPHQGAFDALITAAWCQHAVGALARADEFAAAALLDAEQLGFGWNRLRAGAVAARMRYLLVGASEALELAREVRTGLSPGRSAVLVAPLLDVEIRSLIALGRLGGAHRLLEGAPDVPSLRVAAAALALAEGRAADVAGGLADLDGWSTGDRVQATVLRCAAAGRGGAAELEQLVGEAAAVCLVGPFLGHGTRVDDLLLALPLTDLHPQLAECLRRPRATRGAAGTTVLTEPLTARELTILELLPSHLSYAQIGARLYLSINTVKSNLKSIYRKLGVPTRSEAVDAARASGLL